MEELVFNDKHFEDAVRKELSIHDRPVYVSDALNIRELELDDFNFDVRDCETLCKFKNLEFLNINFGFEDISFISCFENLRTLYFEYHFSVFDFEYLAPLKKLTDLLVSGGDISDMKLANLEAISDIKGLKRLTLHEFGYVDLRPLLKMQQLKSFYCGYADEVVNYDAIGSLVNLESLSLVDFRMDNIVFLKNLPKEMSLLLGGIDFTQEIDVSIINRFKDTDLYENTINNESVWLGGDCI